MINNMNQYGNNLGTPYGAQDYSPFFNGRNNMNMTNQAPSNNLLWVQGLEGAKALMLPPNSKIICLDSEIENRMYIKVADELGATKLRKFQITEILDEEKPSNNLADYVRKDELQQLITELIPSREEVVVNDTAVSTTQPAVIKRTITSSK
ncbi:MAG: hypothetical protein J6T10_29355 [Methanobrevibacter sp.]|nr:hypothetical protein [Methanobrevibacter sp.]